MKHKGKKVLSLLLAALMIVGLVMPSGALAPSAKAAAGDEPAHEKTVTANGDGTYTIALNVTGDSEKQIQKVNVIVIVDRSGSMGEDSGNTTTTYTATNQNGNNLYGLVDGEYVALHRLNGWRTSMDNGKISTMNTTMTGLISITEARGILGSDIAVSRRISLVLRQHRRL